MAAMMRSTSSSSSSASSWWCRMVTIGGVVLLVLLQLVGAQTVRPNCSISVAQRFFDQSRPQIEHADDSSVQVTYVNGEADERSRATGHTVTFLQCCEWASWPCSSHNCSVDFDDRNPPRTTRKFLNCSILADGGSDQQLRGSGLVPAWDFCLRVHSSINSSYTVARDDEGGEIADRSCELRADAAVSLCLYLKWLIWSVVVVPSSATLRVTTRSSDFLATSVQTRAECANVNAGRPCRLTISAKSPHDLEVLGASGTSTRVLGAVEWTGTVSESDGHAQEYEAALSPGKPPKNSGKNNPPKLFEVRISPLAARSVEAATAFQTGRRSLRARGVKEAGSDRFRWSVVVTGTLIGVAGISMLAILCAGKKEDESPGEFLDTVPILPPRFSYSKLQKATRNYSQKLGDGAFGSVYEGTLPNGIRVAVKMLEKTSVQGEKQFRAEVASMGAIRHLNLVRLHGFCSEGAHRLLVYEYMPNGSLDSWLFGKKQGQKLLDWEQRLNIALGTARALAYLHEECSDHIIHLDVKPENILLDHQFCPKLSDFGLAKLMDREQSRVVTSMRGTPGYLAPEWLLPQAAVTAKTDVYSFGMVLLELISGRENTNFSLGKEQWYFPAWAFKLMSEGRTMELLDKRLHVEEVEYFHKQDAMRAIHVALLCIQDDPAARPSMSRVVHMLQGHIEPEPLNARQSAINPPRRLVTAFAASGIDSKSTGNESKPDRENAQSDPKSDKLSRDSRDDSRKSSWSNEHDPPTLIELQNHDMRHSDHAPRHNDANLYRTPVATTPRLPAVTESPITRDTPQPRPMPRHEKLVEFQPHGVDNFKHEVDNFKLEPAVHAVSQYRSSKSVERLAGAHTLGSNPKCIPPWPVKGDVILLRGPQGDFHGVVRDVRVHTKQMRLGLLHRLSSETRWSVREEESVWRHWNESIRTLDFWVVVRWAAIPGRGLEKFPVEWQVR